MREVRDGIKYVLVRCGICRGRIRPPGSSELRNAMRNADSEYPTCTTTMVSPVVTSVWNVIDEKTNCCIIILNLNIVFRNECHQVIKPILKPTVGPKGRLVTNDRVWNIPSLHREMCKRLIEFDILTQSSRPYRLLCINQKVIRHVS